MKTKGNKMKIEFDIPRLKETLDISINTSKTLFGHDDPNYKRIHHHNHHIVLYIKDHIMKERCKNYFEIGTHFGHSMCNVLQSNYPSKFISCDLFLRGATIAGDCKVLDIEALANKNIQKFNKNNYECKILRGNSWSVETFNRVKQEFPEGIDLLFIDGDHRRQPVISDFERYFPLVTSGGYIVFDDYLPLKIQNRNRECPVAIDYLMDKYKDSLTIVGLVDDLVGCNKIRNRPETQNFSYIAIKR
jgi:predicted O-methyltransferase YrrM